MSQRAAAHMTFSDRTSFSVVDNDNLISVVLFATQTWENVL